MTRCIRGWPWVALGLAVCVLQMQLRPEAWSEPSPVKSQQIGQNSDADKTAITKDETSARQVALQAKGVLVRYCHSCHGRDGSAEGGFNYATDLQRLVQRRKVIPGEPEASPLYRKVASGKMPPVDVEPRPTEQEIAVLKQWIAAGAVLPEVPSSRAWVSDTELFQVILADLEKFPPRSRRFLRYFTLHTLYNAGLADDELQTYRVAVSKLINSLSWHPEITRPEAIGENKLVLRIDLRDYFWDAALWNRLLSEYPYAIENDSVAARIVAVQTACRLPVVRADWFLATASRAPLYYELLQLPATAQELERQLRIDSLLNIQQLRVARAGFNNSGIARNNRLIERHYAAHGAYWRTYDFEEIPASLVERSNLIPDRRNLFAYPLGPGNLENQFLHAGGEIIFNLPNGLQGFMLVNARNERINKGPIQLVSDPKRPDRAVECAVSCFGCHYTGILPKSDQIRAFVEQNQKHFSPQDVETIRALYPPDAVMRKLMEKDMTRFRQAVEKTGGRITASEPILLATLRYEANQELAAVAAEVGLPPERFKQKLQELARHAASDSLAATISRNFGPLLLPDGNVSRALLVQAFGDLVQQCRGRRLLNTQNISSTLPDNTGELDPLQDLSATVHAVAFSQDGRRALLAGADKTLRLFDAEQFRETRRLIGHTASVWSVAISPDGRWALSGGADNVVRLWNLQQLREEKPLTAGHTGLVAALAFSENGQRAISACWDKLLILWEIPSGKELARWPIDGYVAALAALPRTCKLAVAVGNEILLLDLRDGKRLGQLSGHRAPIITLAVSSDGQHLASAGEDGSVLIWSSTGGSPKCTLNLAPSLSQDAVCTSLGWSENSEWLAAGTRSGQVYVWRFAGSRPELLGVRQLHDDAVVGLCWVKQPPQPLGKGNEAIIISIDRTGQARLLPLSQLVQSEPNR